MLPNLTPEQLAQIIELAAKGTVGVYPEQADESENYSKEIWRMNIKRMIAGFTAAPDAGYAVHYLLCSFG